jgi:non-ribosomal peptide synthetase component F
VLLVWRDREDVPHLIGLPGLTSESMISHSGTAKFDLTMFVTNGRDGIDVDLEYNTDLFDEARIERLAGHFETLLEGAAANSSEVVSMLPILIKAERDQLLVEWNEVEADEVHS